MLKGKFKGGIRRLFGFAKSCRRLDWGGVLLGFGYLELELELGGLFRKVKYGLDWIWDLSLDAG
jgi:hypothetical protein